MITIKEYLLSKDKKLANMIHATNKTVYDIVFNEVEKLGPNADLNHIDMHDVTTFVFKDDGKHTPFKTFTDDDFYDDWEPLRFGNDWEYFNGDISQWDVSNVKYMCSLFEGCERFNCDISKWDVGNCRYTAFMFNNAIKFDQDLSEWNLHDIESDTFMFNGCNISDNHKPKGF